MAETLLLLRRPKESFLQFQKALNVMSSMKEVDPQEGKKNNILLFKDQSFLCLEIKILTRSALICNDMSTALGLVEKAVLISKKRGNNSICIFSIHTKFDNNLLSLRNWGTQSKSLTLRKIWKQKRINGNMCYYFNGIRFKFIKRMYVFCYEKEKLNYV